MSIGPGKYDAQLIRVMRETRASSGCLVLFGGPKGSGVSCKIEVPSVSGLPGDQVPAIAMVEIGHRAVAEALRNIADGIEQQIPEVLAAIVRESN